ncbi:MAG: hypothetical protein IEMM0008_0864 [bacterium]|nr:MAG: hypothetical protein IEMM0008_0864 [bacterium]
MTQDLEDISLKVLRILYHYHHENPGSGLDKETLEEKFNFLSHKKGKEKVAKALSELIQLGLAKTYRNKNMITEQGIKHYESFKFFKSDELERSSEIMVQGDWYGSNNHYQSHYHVSRADIVHFPGETKEFIHHYDELLGLIKETENYTLDSPAGEKILEKLEEMKSVINQDSQLGGDL